jgi:hypothetical protein
MFDFTEGWTWFVGGLGITLFFVLLIVVFAAFAKAYAPR